MDAKSIFQNGLNKAMRKDYQGALVDFNIAIGLEPYKYPGFYNNRGAAKSYLGDKKGALKDYIKAVEMNPNSAHFYYNLAETRAFLKDYEGAIEDYKRSLKINPLDGEVILQKHLTELFLVKTKNEVVNDKEIKVFISYSHRDEDLKIELDKHLSSLKRMNLINTWHDRKIIGGDKWIDEIDANLESAKIFLALISSDFVNSEYCYSKELKRALIKHENGDTTVIPIVLRPVMWSLLPIGKLQALPKDAKPITTWENVDTALMNVSEGILEVIKKIKTTPNKTCKG